MKKQNNEKNKSGKTAPKKTQKAAQKAEYQQRRRIQRCQQHIQRLPGRYQHGQRGHHTLLCHKTGDQRRRNPPVPKAERSKQRSDDARRHRKNAVLRIRHHIELNIKRLQRP